MVRVIREERFKRVAEKRTTVILEQLRRLGNCANRQSYSYTEEDVNKIFKTIDKRVKEARSKFDLPKKEEFKL